jgi:hypothetical protein
VSGPDYESPLPASGGGGPHAATHADAASDEVVDATQAPTTAAFGDAAAAGADLTKAAPVLHKHGMPANPITAHEAAGDPHLQYALDSDLTTHAAAADPHAGYQKESERGAASGYASLDATTKVPTAELGGAGADATKFLRGDQSWATPAGGSGATQRTFAFFA